MYNVIERSLTWGVKVIRCGYNNNYSLCAYKNHYYETPQKLVNICLFTSKSDFSSVFQRHYPSSSREESSKDTFSHDQAVIRFQPGKTAYIWLTFIIVMVSYHLKNSFPCTMKSSWALYCSKVNVRRSTEPICDLRIAKFSHASQFWRLVIEPTRPWAWSGRAHWVRTKHGPGVHGPPTLDRVHGPLSWTGSMDPLSWTGSMDSFFK